MTIRELARLARTSPATVSMALNDHPRISAAMKTRILHLARRHHYRVDGRVSELMQAIRMHSPSAVEGCLGVVSLYKEQYPWKNPARHSHREQYRGMAARAAELGYRLESFWISEPGMTPRRLKTIIETRGVRALLSLGGPDLDGELPPELLTFPLVTIGVSLRNRLNRVVTHFAQNTTRVLTALKERGYRRPGAVLKRHEDGRTAHMVSGIYMYFSRYVHEPPEIPIFYSDLEIDPKAFDAWYRQHRPDVIVYCEHEAFYPQFLKYFDRRSLRVPRHVGLAGIDCAVHPDWLSGVRQNAEQMGASAVDMVLAGMQPGGPRKHPKTEFVEGDWLEGETLRAVKPMTRFD